MRIINLHLKNIGPFKTGDVDFATHESESHIPVTIITGLNGSGKSIIIDAIRAVLQPQSLERNIVANPDDFEIKLDYILHDNEPVSNANLWSHNHAVSTHTLEAYFQNGTQVSGNPDWVVDYWTSRIPTDPFKIQTISAIDHTQALTDSLKGTKSNVELVNFLCHVDYLRNSDIQEERKLGKNLYEKIKEIIDNCLDNGHFKYIRRTEMMPVVEQNGHEVSFDKLSMGNIFLIEHLVMLVCKMYSICVLNHKSPEELTNIPGVLLIDEIENHLHPQWQKKVLGIIRKTFPALQIILTTHSPFVVSSAQGARIYVCEPQPGYSEIKDMTDYYANLPVDEVLQAEIFDVGPFNEEISCLMDSRKKAYRENRTEEARAIEQKLFEINPNYFCYLKPLISDNPA